MSVPVASKVTSWGFDSMTICRATCRCGTGTSDDESGARSKLRTWSVIVGSASFAAWGAKKDREGAEGLKPKEEEGRRRRKRKGGRGGAIEEEVMAFFP